MIDSDLEAKFNLMNKICFDGSLPMVDDLRYKKHNYCNGVFIIEKNLDHTNKYSIELDPSLENSDGLDYVLLHEMVHFWSVLNGQKHRRHCSKFRKRFQKANLAWGGYLLGHLSAETYSA